jgi:hypothetical protein
MSSITSVVHKFPIILAAAPKFKAPEGRQGKKFHTEDAQLVEATIQNVAARDLYTLVSNHNLTEYARHNGFCNHLSLIVLPPGGSFCT